MKLSRFFTYSFGIAAFSAIICVYSEYIYLLGFPDGFITELEYAERELAFIFIALNIVFGAFFFYLGWKALKMKIGRKLFVATILYLLILICLYLIDNDYQLRLMNSSGG